MFSHTAFAKELGGLPYELIGDFERKMVTDYGVRKGFKVLYRKRKLPTPKQLEKFSEKWRPYRSVAALYLWRIADTAKKKKSLPK